MLENYLIDLDILTKLLMDGDVVQKPLDNEGEVGKLLFKLALSQVRDVALRLVYEENDFIGLGLRRDDLGPTNTQDIAHALSKRIRAAKLKLGRFRR